MNADYGPTLLIHRQFRNMLRSSSETAADSLRILQGTRWTIWSTNEEGNAMTSAQASETPVSSLLIGHGPISDIAVDGDDGTLVVTNYGDRSACVIGPGDRGVNATLPIDGEPVLADVANNRVYVASSSASYDSVSVIDPATGTVIATRPIEYGVTALVADPDAHRAFVGRAGRDGAQLAVIDETLGDVEVIDIAGGSGLLVEALRIGATGFVYAAVSDAATSCLYVVDIRGARVVAGMVIGAPIRDIAVAPDNHTVYVLTCDPNWGGAVTVIDTACQQQTAAVAIDGFPTQMAIGPDGRLYVLNGNNVDVICAESQQRVGGLMAGAPLSCVAVDSDGVLHVADYSGVVTSLTTTPAATEAPVELRASA
jgi:YVTN family beta-propeller protein